MPSGIICLSAKLRKYLRVPVSRISIVMLGTFSNPRPSTRSLSSSSVTSSYFALATFSHFVALRTSRLTTVTLKDRRTIASFGRPGLIRLGQPAIIRQPFRVAHKVNSSCVTVRSPVSAAQAQGTGSAGRRPASAGGIGPPVAQSSSSTV